MAKIFIITDSNGHLHAFDAESKDVWYGLIVEARDERCLAPEDAAKIRSMVEGGDLKGAIQELQYSDAIVLGRSGGNRFDLVELETKWQKNRAQFE